MTTSDQSLVRATHLERRAYLYVRQSTLQQVVQNTESTRRQYALRERAEALGWPTAQIEVIDCDQGISGTSAADREGFQRLVAEVGMGRAGIVLGLEVSRLARNCSDWHRLVELCAMTDTLILDQDGLYDPTSFNHQLVLGIKGFMSAVEIGVLRARLRGGLLAKAARGELRLGLPVGFVYDELGRVRLHPDAQVRSSIELLFATFRRIGTSGATVKYFASQSLLFPRAGRGSNTQEVVWRPLDVPTLVRLLHNPRYAGAFVYGQRRTTRRPGGAARTTSLPREQWHTLLRGAHPGYIDWDEFERNQQTLRRSALAYGLDNRRSPPREGPALLQGLVLCGVCGGRMTVRYHQQADALVPDYCCITGRMHQRRPLCQVIAGASVDRAVGERLVAAMTPMAIELSLAVRAELQARLDEADKLRMQQVQKVQQEAMLAARRYLQVDPDNRLVASTLETDWNDKLRALAQARDEAERLRASDRATLDEATEARIRALAENFPAVWNDPSTSQRDRKRMAHLLIEDVTLLKSDRLHVHIRFKGGARESLLLPLPQDAWRRRLTRPEVVSRIEELLTHCDEQEAAEHLNAEGVSTGAGKPFDAHSVRWVRYSHGLKTPNDRRRETGKLTTREAAARLGLLEATARAWARAGRLNARRCGRKAVWLIDPLEEQPEAIRRLAAHHAHTTIAPLSGREDPLPPLPARVDELLQDGYDYASIAERLNVEGWSRAAGAFHAGIVRSIRNRWRLLTARERLIRSGKLTTPQMAVLLGTGLTTVVNWVRIGRLRGQREGKGSRGVWLLDPIEDQPESIRQRVAARAIVRKRRGVLSDAAAGQGAV
jgi:DNA invertase Pin-like site-specific DNA recombinase